MLMKLFLFTLSILFTGCIPYQLPPDGSPDPSRPNTGLSITFAISLNRLVADDIPAWEWGESELYVAMGANTTSNDSTFQFYPSTGEIILREGLPTDRGFSIYQGTLRRNEAVAVNVSLIESDCQETNRLQVARALVPHTVSLRDGSADGNIMAQPATQPLINGLIDAARQTIAGFDVVLNQYCRLNKDDVLGTFLFHAQNEQGRIRWNVECVDTCEVISSQGRTYAIRFINRGIHVATFNLESLG